MTSEQTPVERLAENLSIQIYEAVKAPELALALQVALEQTGLTVAEQEGA